MSEVLLNVQLGCVIFLSNFGGEEVICYDFVLRHGLQWCKVPNGGCVITSS